MLFFRAVLCCLAIVASTRARAQSSGPMVFDARINLPLDPAEPTYHDFYINAGSEAGFKKGMFITVVRPVPVHDPVQNKQQGTLNVNVARLQVIHVERQITVARLFSEFTDEERPTLEFEAVMLGDRIDLTSLTMEAPHQKKKKAKETAKEVVVQKVEVQVTSAAAPASLPPASAPAAAASVPAAAQAPSGTMPSANSSNTGPVPVPEAPANTDLTDKNTSPPLQPPAQPLAQPTDSPSARTTDMVRVPVPSGSARAM